MPPVGRKIAGNDVIVWITSGKTTPITIEQKLICQRRIIHTMNHYHFVERKPTAEELLDLRQAVGWSIGDPESFEKGLKNSIWSLCPDGR